MEDVAFTILGAGLFFLSALAGGWMVIVVGGAAEGAPGCAVLTLAFWAVYLLGFTVEHPLPGLAGFAGLACGIWLGVRTAESGPRRSGR
jgi:hypothetical protein